MTNSMFLGEDILISGSIMCSHARAYQIFAESITNPELFLIFRCENNFQGKCTNRLYSFDGLYVMFFFLIFYI